MTKKIKNNYEKEELLIETLQKLPLRAKCYLLRNLKKLDEGKLFDICCSLEYCESPIEIILAIALYIKTNGELYFESQVEITTDEKKYYADFGIFGDGFTNDFIKEDFKLIIECDGYEFHQKTKKQVEYDNKREYDIKMLGYDILRFSGTEIYNDVDSCVNKILKYILAKGLKDE